MKYNIILRPKLLYTRKVPFFVSWVITHNKKDHLKKFLRPKLRRRLNNISMYYKYSAKFFLIDPLLYFFKCRRMTSHEQTWAHKIRGLNSSSTIKSNFEYTINYLKSVFYKNVLAKMVHIFGPIEIGGDLRSKI